MGRRTRKWFDWSFLMTAKQFIHFLKEDLGEDILKLQTDDIVGRGRLLDNEVKILRSEIMRISHEHQTQKEKIKDNKEKIKLNKTLPYLVSNVVEVTKTKSKKVN